MFKSAARVLMLAATAVAVQPASAVIIVTDHLDYRYQLATYSQQLYLDNTNIQISAGAQAQALFLGQGWGYTAIGSGESQPWEFPVANPNAGAPLTLRGQYEPPPTPAGSPPVTPGLYQNVLAIPDPDPLASILGGAVNGTGLFGVTSLLFQDSVTEFAFSPRGSGITPNDGLGGPLWVAFFGTDGTRIQCSQGGSLSDACYFPKSTDTQFSFRSTSLDAIAGVQFWHQDPRGLGFSSIYFTPTPSPLLLMVPALAFLGRSWRRLRAPG